MRKFKVKLYNTLTKKTEELKPLKTGKIGIYSCGPTVYNHIHIGNLSYFIHADTLRRVLTNAGLEVVHVMNITDVDDKTIKVSRSEYPELDALKALKKLTDKYTEIFLSDMALIGNDSGSIDLIRATASIKEMQELIKKLYNGGYAYPAEDGIYFSISKYKESGKTYGQLQPVTVSSTSMARIQNDEYDKESAHDFALWKFQKDGEPAWGFDIDGKNLKGRPGWHIECSAMSREALGQTFDIHTGGIDLIFPHHENEIAQSTAAEDNPLLAKVFFHTEHLLVDGRKMSKSLNNFYTLKDITIKGYDPLALRLMVLQGHYRSQINFTFESLEAAANRLKDLRAFADLRFQIHKDGLKSEDIKLVKARMETAFSSDLAMPQALAELSRLEKMAEGGIAAVGTFKAFITWLDEVLGLSLNASKDISKDQKSLLDKRLKARQAKDWKLSDKLRKEIEETGLGVRDKTDSYIWYRL